MDRFILYPKATRFVMLLLMLIPLIVSVITLAVYQNEMPQEKKTPFWTTVLSGLAVTHLGMIVYTLFPVLGELPLLLIPTFGSFVTVLFAKREPISTHWVKVLMAVIAGSVIGWVLAFLGAYAFTMSLFIR